MLLAIDVGNTDMVFGVYHEKQLIGTFRLKTDSNRTSDEIGLMAYNYFRRFHLDPSDVEAVMVASVVPTVMYSLSSALIKYFGKAPMVVDDGVDPGLVLGVASKERLGPDRSVACVGALEKYGAPLIVLDFGTATTLDALNAQGAYMGGCISAGLRITSEALYKHASMLPRVELSAPDHVLNSTAVGHIQAGIVLGYIGSVEYLIRQAKLELGGGEHITVVATGGLARLVAEHTKLIDTVDDRLILDGLYQIYQKQK